MGIHEASRGRGHGRSGLCARTMLAFCTPLLTPTRWGQTQANGAGQPPLMLQNQLNWARNEMRVLRPTWFSFSEGAGPYLLQINPESVSDAAERVNLLWLSRAPGGSLVWGRSGTTLPGKWSLHLRPVRWGWTRAGPQVLEGAPTPGGAGALGSLRLFFISLKVDDFTY